MKLFKLLFVAIIAFGMVACNNEDVPQINGKKDASISIKVFPSSNSPGLRSVGDLSDPNATTSPGLEAESTIHELEVWVFNGEVLTGYGSADGAEVTDIVASGPSITWGTSSLLHAIIPNAIAVTNRILKIFMLN